MNWKKLTAIVRNEQLQAVEEKLQEIGVRGLTVQHVKGFGEHANFFRHDWLVRHVRIEIFAHEDRVREIAAAIMTAAHTGTAGDGIVAISPVDEVLRIRTCAPGTPDEV